MNRLCGFPTKSLLYLRLSGEHSSAKHSQQPLCALFKNFDCLRVYYIDIVRLAWDIGFRTSVQCMIPFTQNALGTLLLVSQSKNTFEARFVGTANFEICVLLSGPEWP
ncbi:hypothetical protein CEXT_9841 [Caerostris extrusa]|uniref:Uncharacterized protein n=1 Tax=Caerostris extrusa TaxID=172846 RepID=A0AAV4VCQ9_CAEEX|nr:hypothetical protein CEXT_9841 [Caerostris extrusa]